MGIAFPSRSLGTRLTCSDFSLRHLTAQLMHLLHFAQSRGIKLGAVIIEKREGQGSELAVRLKPSGGLILFQSCDSGGIENPGWLALVNSGPGEQLLQPYYPPASAAGVAKRPYVVKILPGQVTSAAPKRFEFRGYT